MGSSLARFLFWIDRMNGHPEHLHRVRLGGNLVQIVQKRKHPGHLGSPEALVDVRIS